MKKNLILSRIFTWCICIYLLPLRAFALTGNQIISSANEYVNFTWVCNSENARAEFFSVFDLKLSPNRHFQPCVPVSV